MACSRIHELVHRAQQLFGTGLTLQAVCREVRELNDRFDEPLSAVMVNAVLVEQSTKVIYDRE
jgi:hypothetical protein